MANHATYNFTKQHFLEGSAPATPDSGEVVIFASNSKMYRKDDAANVVELGGGGSGDVATDAIWDAAGDLAVGSGANTAAKLAIGAAGGALSVINSAVAWNSGTSFPANKGTGDRYWRTDLGMEFYWDGTRWVSTTLHLLTFAGSSATITTTASPLYAIIPWVGEFDIFVVKAYAAIQYAGVGTIDGTKYWKLEWNKTDNAGNRTAIATTGNLTTDTVGRINLKAVAVGAAVTGSYSFDTLLTETSTAADIVRFSAGLSYRIIGT